MSNFIFGTLLPSFLENLFFNAVIEIWSFLRWVGKLQYHSFSLFLRLS